MSFAEGSRSLSPSKPVEVAQATEAEPLLTPAQRASARSYNLRAHAISMLVRIRNFLIKYERLDAAEIDSGQRINQSPDEIVDDAFLEAVAAYQVFKELGSPDGKIGPNTFSAFEENGLGYSLTGGSHASGRHIVPKNAPEAQVYDYFRDIILNQGGIFAETAGHVNIVGVRGGQQDGDGIEHVENTHNRWNDSVVVLSLDAEGNKSVQIFEGTTDPGVSRAGVATIAEGTHAMEYGYHAPSSGAYDALNPAYDGYVPVFRDGQSYLGQGRGAGQWLNLHTTHGYENGLANGPGAYSEGCTVINGEKEFRRFMGSMRSATKTHGQSVIYFTVISAGRMGTMEVVSQETQ